MQSNNSMISKKILNEECKALVNLIQDIVDLCKQQNELIILYYSVTAYEYEFNIQALIKIKELVSVELDKSNYMSRLSWSENKKNLYNCINQCNIDNPADTIFELQRLFPAVVEKKYFQSIVESGNTPGITQFMENRPSVKSMITFDMICHAANQGYTQIVIAMIPFCFSMDQVELGAQNIKAGLIETFLKTRPDNRLHFLLNSIRQLIANKAKHQINSVLKEFNLQLKEKLFESCIGKLSHQGHNSKSEGSEPGDTEKYYHSRKFGRGYTELYFLSKAVFTLREDKRMSIVNIQEYTIYKAVYASGRSNAGLLRPELEFLFKIIGLECDADSDFDKEIIFTPACTKKLINLGVHYNVDYIKNLLFAQNQFRFLTRSWHAKENRPGENALKYLPLDYVSHTLFPFTIKKDVTIPPRILDKSDVDQVINEKPAAQKFAI